MKGNMIPFVDFQPDWLGWRSLGLSPDTIGDLSHRRDEFLRRFTNSVIVSLGRLGARRPSWAPWPPTACRRFELQVRGHEERATSRSSSSAS